MVVYYPIKSCDAYYQSTWKLFLEDFVSSLGVVDVLLAGIHVVAIMFTVYMFGYAIFRAQFQNSPSMVSFCLWYSICLLLSEMIIPPIFIKIILASEYSWCKVWEPGCAMQSVCRTLNSFFLMCVIIGTVRCKVNIRNCIINVKVEVMCLELNSHTSSKHFVIYKAVLVDAACSWWSLGSYCRHVRWDNALHCSSFIRGEEYEGKVANKREIKAIAQYSIWGHGDTSGKARHSSFRSATAPQPYWSSWIGWELLELSNVNAKCRNMSSDYL